MDQANIKPVDQAIGHRDQRGGDIFKIPLSQVQLEEGFNRRTDGNYGDIGALADSIQASGQLTPVRGFKENGVWTITAGHRRFMAILEIAKRTSEEQFIRITKGARDMVGRLVEQYTENVKQPNTEYERALIVKALLDEGLKRAQVIERLGMKGHTFDGLQKMLEAPKDVLDKLRDGEISGNTITAMVRGAKGDNEKLRADVNEAIENKKKSGKQGKATARHSTTAVTRTVQSIIKTAKAKLDDKVENEKELTKSEAFTLKLFTKLLEKQSDRTINDFIRNGE